MTSAYWRGAEAAPPAVSLRELAKSCIRVKAAYARGVFFVKGLFSRGNQR